MVSKEGCGWIICGDAERPCMLKAGHKGNAHRDAAGIERSRAFNQANAEYQRAYSRKWRQDNPEEARHHAHLRRARKRGVPHSSWTRDQVIETYGRVCWICLYPLDCDWHPDHVIPLSRGGWDMIENLRPAHVSCNARKNAKMPPVIAQARVWFELNRHLELMEAT